MIKEFKNEYHFLSNFEPCEIFYEGIVYPSTEHAYQAAKAIDLTTKLIIARLTTAGKAKRLGKEIPLPEDWHSISIPIMRDILKLKFSTEPFKSKLLATGGEWIQEGNTWGDTFWGVDLNTGKGDNILGHLLMEIRGSL